MINYALIFIQVIKLKKITLNAHMISWLKLEDKKRRQFENVHIKPNLSALSFVGKKLN